MYKNVLILLMFISIILIIVDIVKVNTENNCIKNCKPKIIYKCIPNILSEQNQNQNLGETFNSMFNESAPWIRDIENLKIPQETLAESEYSSNDIINQISSEDNRAAIV